MDPLHLTTSRHEGTLTVTVSGELDIATTEPLRALLLELLDEARAEPEPDAAVVVEVSGLSFVDAAGLGVLVHAHNRASGQRTPLLVAGVPPSMQRLLKITGLDAHLVTVA
ncbi:STAS domain-containing protein [Nonomuraea pusilla]|uniref:Anti-sigma factor antagonist n=1 Tax=Nonomuraea pusilla TaxID=46177 RepID=A0A1H7UEH2_9ACTN|nr:STAS domain-containing protein [Nonomuraea pusilla]SEL95105.1 anti-sigma B factor antagonist [Nonomuraea pusilla]